MGARVALLSNPRSTGNRSLLPEVRRFCAEHRDIFHYEVESVDQIGAALRQIARVDPKVLVINGGDGTVQAALTEIHHGGHFGDSPPPVAVLPNGKTNLIALDLGAEGSPLAALERVLELARTDLSPHVVQRELIQLSHGGLGGGRPVLGMFLGGAGLADIILYCRHKIYPLGLPNGFSHFLAAVAVILSVLFGLKGRLFLPRPTPVRISLLTKGELQGRFTLLMVTTLQRILLKNELGSARAAGAMQMMALEGGTSPLLRTALAVLRGRLGEGKVRGLHMARGDEIRIEGDRSSVILDGELFEAVTDHPIVLRPTRPVPFLRLAA